MVTNKAYRYFGLSLACFSPIALAKGNPVFQDYLEQAFSVAIVLTDSDVFTVGVHDFDPNEWFNLDNEDIGSQESINLRQQIAVSTLPYTFDLSDEDAIHKHQLFTRFSILGSRQDLEIRPKDTKDYQNEIILGAFTAYQYRYQLEEHWTLTPGIGVHLQYFKNEHEYRSDFSNQYVKPVLDNVIFNTDAWAASLEPHVQLRYDKPTDWGSWNATSSLHYFYGQGWGEANYGDVGNPEGWYMANGIEAYYNVSKWGRSVQSFYSSFRRIDIGGDTSAPLGTPYYYEGSIGWLMTPPFESEWIDNVGIGLNINYGSNLKGGSIVLFFNQVD
ncbi:Solitary outer membrane autotransporter beta-barrel domain [Vibrio sp. TBV020]|uniref:Solitary outer membrane autotransporter beta-barrel domain n=1 Tax=Vibrio sp. TBV020 TaxID=3137398 RepID=UPI0038CD80B3